ncbi:MAG: hypothetical protein ACTSVL_04830, partial [Promethearchaeota archaeon]
LDRRIERFLKIIHQNHIPKIVPILGEAGTGKSHYYWILKNQELKMGSEAVWRVIYIPTPPLDIHIPLHILNCILDEQGEFLLKNTARNLLLKFQDPNDRSFEELKTRVISYYGGVHSEIIRVLIKYVHPEIDSKMRELAKRWLFADNLTQSELEQLHVKKNIEDDLSCFTLLRIFDEFANVTLIYYMDEMELLYRLRGAQAELSYWETIKKIFNESRNSLIITTCLLEVFDRVRKSLDATVLSRFEPEVYLKKFQIEDAIKLFLESMKLFWTQFNLKIPPNPFYPLNRNIIEMIFTKSDGNPRQIIRLLSKIFNEIILGEVNTTSICENAQLEQKTAFLDFIEPKIIPQLKIPIKDVTFDSFPSYMYETHKDENKMENKNKLLPPVLQPHPKKASIMISNENYFVQINSNSILSGIISILNAINTHLIPCNTASNYQISIQGSQKTIALMVEIKNSLKIGIQIPLSKDFKHISKAQAYYLALDSLDSLTWAKFDKMILIIPSGLIDPSGSLLKQLKDAKEELLVVELTEEEAGKFIEASTAVQVEKLREKQKLEEILEFCFQNNNILNKLSMALKKADDALKEELKENLNENLEVDDLRDFLISLNK